MLALAAAIPLLLGVGTAWLWHTGVRDADVQISPDRHTLTAYHRVFRYVLWRLHFRAVIMGKEAERVPWPGNLLVCKLGATADDGGRFLLLKRESGKRVWQDRPDYDEVARIFGDDAARTGFHCEQVRFADVDGNSRPEMVVRFIHQKWFPACILVYRQDLSRMGAYYHAGHLSGIDCTDVDDDGKFEIVARGTNNKHGGATIVLLDDQHCSGVSADAQTLPHFGEPEGAAIRIILPHFGPEFAPHLESLSLQVTELRFFRTGGTTTIDATVGAGDALLDVTLSSDLRPIRVRKTDPFVMWQRDLPDSLSSRPTQAWLDAWLASTERFGAAR